MDDKDDVATTVLSQIADALEEHNKILAVHRKYIERLSGEIAGIKKDVEDLKASDFRDTSDAKFIAGVSARLKAISTTLEAKS